MKALPTWKTLRPNNSHRRIRKKASSKSCHLKRSHAFCSNEHISAHGMFCTSCLTHVPTAKRRCLPNPVHTMPSSRRLQVTVLGKLTTANCPYRTGQTRVAPGCHFRSGIVEQSSEICIDDCPVKQIFPASKLYPNCPRQTLYILCEYCTVKYYSIQEGQ